MITLIAAVARNGVIGNGNAIPWHLPEDFKHFSATTKGAVVVMGYLTWESLPEKFRPLPNRLNIVISLRHQPPPTARWGGNVGHGIAIARSAWAQAEMDSRHYPERPRLLTTPEIFIIGGASIYEQTIDLADRLVISEVDLSPEGDTFFPKIGPEWRVHSRDEREGFAISDYRRG